MGRPWAELSSAERMGAVLRAVAELRYGEATASVIATAIEREHRMERPRHGRGRGSNSSRAMSTATRVTPAITALRTRGLIGFAARRDGLSGTADSVTANGRLVLTRGRSVDNGVIVPDTRAEEDADA